MKKTLFTALRAMCVGAMTLFAVSCYDDSALWSEIEELDARLTALEEKLNTEVATLNSKLGALETAYEKADSALLASVQKLTSDLDALDGTVDGYVKSNDEALKAAIEEYKKADETLAAVDTDILAALATMGVAKVEKNAAGNVVITFVDESTVEVGAADANANNTNLVTVVDGKWAVVGADGKTTVLDAELHPDTKLAFKVNADNNELYVSYDDGANWEPTGVIVKDATTINVVTAFEDGEDFVTLTVGGVEYQLPKYVADNSSLVLGRTDVFFGYGVTKTVELNAEEVTECYVMTKPDGWKATLDGTTLTVTAPAEELVKIGAGELKGQVLVHANTTNGACKVVELDVTTGPSLTLSYEDGNITVFNALTFEENMGWESMTSFVEIYLGIAKASDVAEYESIEAFAEDNRYNTLSSISYYAGLCENGDQWYVDGVLEEQNMTIPLSVILEDDGIVLEEGVPYVLWILPTEGQTPLFEKTLYVGTGSLNSLVASESVYNNATLSFSHFGADGVIIGATSKTYLDQILNTDPENPLTDEDLFGFYLQTGVKPGWNAVGPFISFIEGDATAMGTLYTTDYALDETTTLADVVLTNHMGKREVSAASDYFVWMLPYYKDKPLADYTMDEVVLYTCSTAPMEFSPECKASVEYTVSYNEFEYTITTPEGCSTYYYVMLKTEYSDFGLAEYSDEELRATLKNWCSEPAEKEFSYKTESWEGINPNTEYILMTYTEGGGFYGAPVITEIKTLNVPVGQWIIDNADIGELIGAGTNKFVFDVGATLWDNYYSYKIFTSRNAWGFGINMEEVVTDDPSYVGVWMVQPGMFGDFTISVSDEKSGTIIFSNETEIPYSDLTENSCVFDFTNFLGVPRVEATLSTDVKNVVIQG